MISLSFVLSNLTVFKMPFGGSITLGSMVPLIIISLKHGLKYGVTSSFVYSIIQIFSGFHSPPVKNFYSYILVIALDYILPYTFLGTASFFYNKFRHHKVLCSSIVVTFSRYICSIISGIIIWKDSFPPATSIWKYSIIYNSVYMIPEIIITCTLCTIIYKNKFLKFTIFKKL